MENIKQKFAVIEDARHQSYVEHKLCDILIIIMCAVLCGLDECRIVSENGLKTLNIFRTFALFLHKQFMDKQIKKKSLKGNMLNCLMNDNLMISVVASL